MMKPAATLASLLLLAATASADTVTTQADTLVVVTPNAPVIVQQGEPQSVAQPIMPPGAAEMPPAPPSAQPVVVANSAPQNEDWNNVSHINGTPVKVGERNEYLYKFKKNNIAANPFGLFFGLYDLSASHAVSQNLAVSAAVTGTDEFFQFSATLPLYFRRTFSGPYLEPGLLIRSEKDYYYDDCYDCSYSSSSSTMSTSWTGPQLMIGWQWMFDSGLNMQAAFGLAKKLDGNNDPYSSDEPEANGYFRVGYAF
jgi:hypothetical protein